MSMLWSIISTVQLKKVVVFNRYIEELNEILYVDHKLRVILRITIRAPLTDN